MTMDKKEANIVRRETKATTKRIKVRPNEVVLDKELYCHRGPDALSEEKLRPLMDSLVSEGLQVPIEVFEDERKRKVVVKGHRRVSACLLLAAKNTPNFASDMELEAILVENATDQDLLLRSVSDNEVRRNLDRVERIRAAKKLFDAKVDVPRAARALGVSVKTFDRDLLIAKHGWMFQHVIDGSIQANNAYVLLEEAEKAGRVRQVKEDLDAWIAETKREIRDKERQRKLQGGKDLRPGEKQAKRHMPAHLVAHWVDLIREHKGFDEKVEWNFAAGIEPESGHLRIPSLNLDVNKTSVDQLAKVASKLSRLAKLLGPVLKKRHDEAAHGGAASPEEMPYDLEYLRECGAEDIAEKLEEQFEQAAEEADNEAAAADIRQRGLAGRRIGPNEEPDVEDEDEEDLDERAREEEEDAEESEQEQEELVPANPRPGPRARQRRFEPPRHG